MTYTLNLWGPMFKMANAASQQALEEFKTRLRKFLESSDTGRQAIAMSGGGDIPMPDLNGYGRNAQDNDEDEDI